MTDWHGYDEAARSLCVNAFGDWHSVDLWKHNDDLRRYDQVIRDTRPDVIIETGTNTGASASYMAAHTMVHPYVITIDIEPNRFNRAGDYGIRRLGGSSVDPDVLQSVRYILAESRQGLKVDHPRVMVSLDSDHSAKHVLREIELYAPLVTPGCHLVVEDGIMAWLGDKQLRQHCLTAFHGTPLDAIEGWQGTGVPALEWTRDQEIEFAYPVTMSPAGWWRRDG